MNLTIFFASRQSNSDFVVTMAKFFWSFSPAERWWYSASQIIIFYVLCLLVFFSMISRDTLKSKPARMLNNLVNSKSVFAFLIFIMVFLNRLPTTVHGYLNPDESLWVGCAKTLWVEPRLWLTCDTSTSGPIVVAPLLLLKLFNLPIDFGTTRIACAIVLATTAVFIFLTYERIFRGTFSRLFILLFITATGIAMSTYWDFMAYNGEYMPVMLLCVSLYLLAGIFRSPGKNNKRIILLGFVLGMIPFAKLQATPLALTVTVASGLVIFKRQSLKPVIYFAIAGITPLVCIVLLTAAGGGLSHFFNSYIMYNLVYATSETPEGTSFWEKIAYGWDLLFGTPEVIPYFQASFILTVAGIVGLNYRNIREKAVAEGLWVLIFSLILFLVSLYSIAQPHRQFLHYTLFGFLTTTLIMASALNVCFISHFEYGADVTNNYRKVVVVAALMVVSAVYFHRVFQFNPHFYSDAFKRKDSYAHIPEVVNAINAFSEPGDRLAIWGWSGTFFSDTDLLMGTRYADTSGIILYNSFSPYFLTTYIEDLERNKPKIFLDAISSRSHRFHQRENFGFHRYPELKAYIDKHYNKVAEVEGFIVYRHN